MVPEKGGGQVKGDGKSKSNAGGGTQPGEEISLSGVEGSLRGGGGGGGKIG